MSRLVLLFGVLCLAHSAAGQSPADSAALPASTPADALSPEQVYELYIRAIGGRAAVEAVRSESFVITMSAQGVTLTGEMRCRGVDRFLLTMNQGGLVTRVGADGASAWQHSTMTGYELQPLKEIVLQMRVFNMNAVVRDLVKQFPAVTAAGAAAFAGESCHRLKLADQNGETLFAYFSTTTGLFAGQEIEQQTPQGVRHITFRARSWEPAGDVKVFRAIEIRQDDAVIGTIEYTGFRFNDVRDEVLALPDEVKALLRPREPSAAPGKE